MAVLRHPTGLSSLPQVCPQPHPAMHGCNPWGAPKVWELEGTPGPGKTSSVSSASLLVTQQGDLLALIWCKFGYLARLVFSPHSPVPEVRETRGDICGVLALPKVAVETGHPRFCLPVTRADIFCKFK